MRFVADDVAVLKFYPSNTRFSACQEFGYRLAERVTIIFINFSNLVNNIFLFGSIVSVVNEFFGSSGRVAEPIHEEEVKVAVTVGTTSDGAVAGSKSSGVGLVRCVAIEGASGAVFDIDGRATTGGIRIVANVVIADRVVSPAAVEDGAEEISGIVKLIDETIVKFVTRSGVGTAKASGRAILNRVRPRIRNQALFLFEENEKNLRVNLKCVCSVVNDLGGSARWRAGWYQITISNTFGKNLIGKTNEMAVFNVIMNRRIPSGFISFAIVTVAVIMKEFINFFNGHGFIIPHCVIRDDVARTEISKRSGLRVFGEFECKEGEDGDKGKKEGNFVD